MLNLDPLLATDFYKTGHLNQYPEGTEYVFSNFTPRSSRIATSNNNVLDDFDDRVVFLGLQGFIKTFLIGEFNKNFFDANKADVCRKYQNVMDNALGTDAVTTEHFEALHDLGYLPIEIKALPEGSRVNCGVPMFTIVNTLPQFYWLTNYLETVISAEIWKSCTTATIAYEYKRLLVEYANKTGAPLDFVGLQAHDFSFRGMSGWRDAATSGMGHLSSFIGTDTIAAIDYAKKFYNATGNSEPIGVSVPATEHSVMCLGGKEDEIETFRNLIVNKYPSGIISIVSDTWDYWKVLTEYLPKLKFEILDRTPNELGLAKTVIRPDSGDPVKIVCGYNVMEDSDFTSVEEFKAYFHNFEEETSDVEAIKINGTWYEVERGVDILPFVTTGKELPEHVVRGSIEVLWDTFGGTETEKGYKVLNERIGLIYGDSITLMRAKEILTRLEAKGFASCNIVFGVGSYTYQYNTRDTFGFAMKATWGMVNGEERAIFKDPKTDNGTKKSAKGLMAVHKTENGFKLVDNLNAEDYVNTNSELRTVFKDGELGASNSLDSIRNLLTNG